MITMKDRVMSLPIASNLLSVAPNYINSVLSCAKQSGYSSIWTICTLANVTGVSIESIYPPMNGKTDRPFRLLNMLVVPQNSFNASRQIHVIWTRLEDYKQGHYWYPDHFVPLLDNYVSPEKQQPIKFSSSPCIDSLDGFPPPLSSVSKKRRIDNTSSSRNMSYTKHDTFTDSLSSSPSSPQKQNKNVHSLSQQNSPVKNADQPSPDHNTNQKSVAEDCSLSELNQSSDEQSDSNLNDTIDQLLTSATSRTSPVSSKMKPLPVGGFTAHDIYHLLLKKENVLDKIPLGQKNNCFSVIDNSVNNERKRNNKYNRFCDDLCSWDSEKGTTVKSYYILSQNFKCV
jgi:hypothetical protein